MGLSLQGCSLFGDDKDGTTAKPAAEGGNAAATADGNKGAAATTATSSRARGGGKVRLRQEGME